MRAVVLDCETTGLIQNHTLPLDKQPSIIEFYAAACTFNKSSGAFKVDHELHYMIKPPQLLGNKPIKHKSKKTIESITGITDAMLEDKPPFSGVADEVIRYLEAAPLVIAHNASFDQEMVDLEADRLGRKVAWPRLLCTVEQTMHCKGWRLSLPVLHEHLFGTPFTAGHRARVDVLTLARCVGEMHRRGWL